MLYQGCANVSLLFYYYYYYYYYYHYCQFTYSTRKLIHKCTLLTVKKLLPTNRNGGVLMWLSGCVQRWDDMLPNGYRTSGLTSNRRKRPAWDGLFKARSHSVARQLEQASDGYGADGKLLCHQT